MRLFSRLLLTFLLSLNLVGCGPGLLDTASVGVGLSLIVLLFPLADRWSPPGEFKREAFATISASGEINESASYNPQTEPALLYCQEYDNEGRHDLRCWFGSFIPESQTFSKGLGFTIMDYTESTIFYSLRPTTGEVAYISQQTDSADLSETYDMSDDSLCSIEVRKGIEDDKLTFYTGSIHCHDLVNPTGKLVQIYGDFALPASANNQP